MENKEAKTVQQNMIYNTVGGVLYYFCQWLMSIVVVRMSGYEDQGVLSLALSVTAAPAVIGLFNVRNYQVSDLEGKYTNDTYIRSRVWSNLLSVIVCAIMVLANGYSLYKAGAIFAYMAIKVVEGFSDVYYGIEQKYQRLDYAGISQGSKGIGTIVWFVVVYHFTDNLILGILAVAVWCFLIYVAYDRPRVKKLTAGKDEKAFTDEIGHTVRSLLIECLPLAIVAFLNNLTFNIPKIYLEDVYGSEIMGIYSSVATPTVVIQLVATTLFAPLVPILTEAYQNRDHKKFNGIIGRFAALALGLSVVVLIAATFLGEWLLALFFGDSIIPYVYLFVPVILMTITIAVNACLFSMCTLLREIKRQYIVAAVGIVSSVLMSYFFINAYDMMGVVYATMGSLVLQIVIQVWLILRKLKEK